MFIKIFKISFFLATAVSTAYFQTSPSTGIEPGLSKTLIEGRVVIVYDGDTIAMEDGQRKLYAVRIQAIDAPEDKQDFGNKSRKKLSDLISGKRVSVILHSRDQSERYVGSVYLNGENVGLKQIESGMAWHFKRDLSDQTAVDRKSFAQAEIRARADRKGLWDDNAPVPPWEFRGENLIEASVVAEPVRSLTEQPPVKIPVKSDPNGKTYILGPRGGCYYVSQSGRKVYVKDKSLCGSP